MTTSTPANANSPANISPVGPPPAISTACSVIASRCSDSVGPSPLDASLGAVFDHVGIAVSDLAASERFYRTVLSALGIEPSHADAELVQWEDWDIGPTDSEHPVTRGLHVCFRARDRAQVGAFG